KSTRDFAFAIVLCGRHSDTRNGATNTDHLTTVLNLQFAIYCRLKNIEKKITCLQQLISLHPFNPWNWKLLAETYMSFLQTLPPSFISEMKHLQGSRVSLDL
uniref:Uncharacterized protein n=1 Tax=Gopherus agassizii TaxID=38772 RepID=A0A452GNV6_9SAUR